MSGSRNKIVLSPTAISDCSYWFDHTNEPTLSTTTTGGGIVVDTVKNLGSKSEYLMSQQGADSIKPLKVAGTRNLPALEFDGVGTYMALTLVSDPTTEVDITLGADVTFWAVSDNVPDASMHQGIIVARDSDRYRTFYHKNGSTILFSAYGSPGASDTVAPADETIPALIMSIADETASTIDVYFNGTSDGSTATPASLNTGAHKVWAGKGAPSDHYLTGTISEWGIFEKALDSEEIAFMEDYISQKYGITMT